MSLLGKRLCLMILMGLFIVMGATSRAVPSHAAAGCTAMSMMHQASAPPTHTPSPDKRLPLCCQQTGTTALPAARGPLPEAPPLINSQRPRRKRASLRLDARMIRPQLPPPRITAFL